MIRKLLAATALVASIVAVSGTVLIAEEPKADTSSVAVGTYKIDPTHSFATFRVIHMNTSATYGSINMPTGTFEQTADGIKVDVILDVNNIDTANEARDKHLKGPDFFLVKQYPKMSFKSTSSKKIEGGYEVSGDLTIKATTKSITVKLNKVGEAKGIEGDSRVGYETMFNISRQEYGVTFGAGAVGDDVKIAVAFEASKP